MRGGVWPRAGIYFENLLKNTIIPAVNCQLPATLRRMGEASCGQVDWGECQPNLGPITVRECDEARTIVDVGLDLSSPFGMSETGLSCVAHNNKYC